MLSVVIIDDEAPARRYLRRLLEAAPDVHVTGEASTIEQAWRLVRECRPDAIFLDIELTCGTGFDLLPMLSPAPAVVFVTAHSDHAARAFDVEAVDYLLKPATPLLPSCVVKRPVAWPQKQSRSPVMASTPVKAGQDIVVLVKIPRSDAD